MTDKELKKLNRSDLLRLLVEQSHQMEAVQAEAADNEAKLRAENQQLRQQLENRQLTCSQAGSLAEAAVSLNGVMEAAQKAADQYLENIKRREAEQDARLSALEAERKAKAERILADAQLECAEKLAATEQACAAQTAETEQTCAALKVETEQTCAAQRTETEEACSALKTETEQTCAAQKAETEELCSNATNEALTKIDAYWNDLRSRLESLYETHMGMQKLLADANIEPKFTSAEMLAVLMGDRSGGAK